MLQQLVYVSRATFAPRRDHGGIEPEVGRILMTSQRNNPQRGLVGALYFGNGYFFQCLEGDSEALDALLQCLQVDPRHDQMRVLRRRAIAAPGFSRWSMKYVPVADDVQRVLREHGRKDFDPYRFDEALIDAFVELLQSRPGAASPPGASAAVEQAGTRPPVRRAEGLAWLALVVGLLALVLSSVALLRP